MDDERLSLIANLCQLASFAMLLDETTNKELMEELRQQDKILEEQTDEYLREILERLTKIEKVLKKKGILDYEE